MTVNYTAYCLTDSLKWAMVGYLTTKPGNLYKQGFPSSHDGLTSTPLSDFK
jgi:hypothetical protein